TSSVAVAQDGRFSIGAELALPMGDFGDASSIGFGGSVRYEHPVGDNIGLTGTVGYLIFGGKETSEGGVTFDGPDYSMIPIQVGGKYYFTEQQLGFYAGLELGVHSTTAKIPSSSITIGGVTIETPEVSTSSTDLSYAPQIGYHLA